MNILYVLRSIAHFAYHESTIRHLCGNGHKVTALFDWRTSRHYSDYPIKAFQANTTGFTMDWSIRRNDLWRRLLFAAREVRSYTNYLRREDQSDYYLRRWAGYLPSPVRLAVKLEGIRKFLTSDRVQSLLRTFEDFVPADQTITRWLKNHRPDIVVASPANMRFSEEIEYVKAARAVGIPTVVPVLSWDNLTTKGIFHVIPDLTLVWNQAQFDEATKIHNIPSDKIFIAGAPFFDKWLEAKNLLVEREVFCRKVGLESRSPFLVYLGSSSNIALDETWLVRELAVCLRRHPDPDMRRMNILVRPHPANARIYKDLDDEQIIVWPKEGTLPDSMESMQDFFNTLYHSVTTVGINTSGMIDAVIVDKPCVSILTERYLSTQLQAIHFQYLLNADVLEITRSASECAEVIGKLWLGKDSKRKQRQRFVLQSIRPWGVDVPAGHIAARAIDLAALGKSAAQIASEIGSPASQESSGPVLSVLQG